MSFQELANASTMFLLKGLGLHMPDLNKYGFISAFVDDINHDIKYESSVFVLFKPEILEDLQRFISKEYKRTDFLKEDYDYEGGFVVMAYKFPEKFKLDYQRFLMGQYSQFSKEYKSLFPTMVTVKREDGTTHQTYDVTYHIFNKSKSLRKYLSKKAYGEVAIEGTNETEPLEWLDEETELWSSPSLTTKDVLDINKIKEQLLNKSN